MGLTHSNSINVGQVRFAVVAVQRLLADREGCLDCH